MATSSCFLQISLQILVIFDQKNIWHKLLGVVYHVKKVSTIFDENWSHNINLKKKCSISWKVIWKPIVHCRGHSQSLAYTKILMGVGHRWLISGFEWPRWPIKYNPQNPEPTPPPPLITSACKQGRVGMRDYHLVITELQIANQITSLPHLIAL